MWGSECIILTLLGINWVGVIRKQVGMKIFLFIYFLFNSYNMNLSSTWVNNPQSYSFRTFLTSICHHLIGSTVLKTQISWQRMILKNVRESFSCIFIPNKIELHWGWKPLTCLLLFLLSHNSLMCIGDFKLEIWLRGLANFWLIQPLFKIPS